MKLLFLSALLIGCSVACSGCLTSKVVEKAKDQQQWNAETKEQETVPGHAAYYALMPLTVPVIFRLCLSSSSTLSRFPDIG